MLSKVKQFIAGEQVQAAYEKNHADELEEIAGDNYQVEKQERADREYSREVDLLEEAKEKAIRKAQRRGNKNATPITERIEDNFDEAFKRAKKVAEPVAKPVVNKIKKDYGTFKKNISLKAGAKKLEGAAKEGLKLLAPTEPAYEAARDVRERAYSARHHIRAPPVRQKAVVGNPNKGKFGTREDGFRDKPVLGNRNKGIISQATREKPVLGNPNKGQFGKYTTSQMREKPTIGNRNRGNTGLRAAGEARESIFGNKRNNYFKVTRR